MEMLKSHRQYIIEWKSVNDDVKEVAEAISKMMWDKSRNDSPMLDRELLVPFISGEFPFRMEGQFGIDKIEVCYRLYFFDSVDDYNRLYDRIGNSEYDEESKRLTIRGGLVEGYFNYTITQEIYHELNHAFEYGMGMEKREDLYEKAVSMANDKDSDEFSRSICKLVYYTFSHEQDTFAHQFYGLIHSEGLDDDFDVLIMNFPIYRDFYNCKSYVKGEMNKNVNKFKSVLSYLGLDVEQFNKRIYFGAKRLKKKLHNVYIRHMYELRNGQMDFRTEAKREGLRNHVLNEMSKRYIGIQFENGGI